MYRRMDGEILVINFLQRSRRRAPSSPSSNRTHSLYPYLFLSLLLRKMKPTNPKITWQPYPATRPTEAGDYFVTLECEDKGLGIFTFILPFIPQRGRFFYKLRNDKRVLAWAPLTTAHLIRYDEEKPKPMDSYMVKLATPDAALPFTYRSLFYSSNERFFVIKEKDAQVIAWGLLPKPYTGDLR